MGFRKDGKTYAQYVQYDSYPGGWPRDFAAWLFKPENFDRLCSAEIRFVPWDAGEPMDEDREQYGGLRDPRVNRGEGWYSLLRHQQGDIESVVNNKVMFLAAPSWLGDSLFCEYAYIANLDEGALEVYEGFQKAPHEKGRYHDYERGSEGYYPVALVETFKLNEAMTPDEWVDAVNMAMRQEEE